jgi:rare lipoprotein A
MLKAKKCFLCLFISIIVGSCIWFINQIQVACDQARKDDLQKVTIIKNIERFLIKTVGIASHYSDKFHSRRTASGEKFDMYGYTAAHRKLPFGTIVKVVNLHNNKMVLVKINDRGPFIKGRIIDLSYRAAKHINGLGIPKAEIQHFDVSNVLIYFDDTYYFGYSLRNPFIITKKENVMAINETFDFEAAINMFYLLEEQNYMEYYLFVEVGSVKKNSKYVIGYIDPDAVVFSGEKK